MLSREFNNAIGYIEEIITCLSDFVICVWEMTPKIESKAIVANHVIVADGCIDLVVDFRYKEICFAGMSKTKFDDRIELPSRHMGARLKAGAFQAITGFNANEAMDKILPLSKVCKGFNEKEFFTKDKRTAKSRFIDLLRSLTSGKELSEYTTLFDRLYRNLPDTTGELYDIIGYSPKQCQRLFDKHFGLTPQMVLSVLRFQMCLSLLVDSKIGISETLGQVNYYDQAHFTNDFKKNIGITPLDLIKLYK